MSCYRTIFGISSADRITNDAVREPIKEEIVPVNGIMARRFEVVLKIGGGWSGAAAAADDNDWNQNRNCSDYKL